MTPFDALNDEVAPQWLRDLPKALRPLTFRLVETRDELKAASHLVYREYLRRGYIKPNAAQMRLLIFHALPDTTALIALSRRRVIGTMTIIEDSPLGLPMEEVYKPELDALRRQGHHLAEVSMLSFDHDLFSRRGLPRFQTLQLLLLLRLFKLMLDYLRSCTNVTELVVCFNPRHQILYDFLHLQPLGSVKPYPMVNSRPAVARHLNIAATQQLAPYYPVLQFLYGKVRSAFKATNRLLLSLEDLRELFLSSTPILASASPTELAYLQRCYPTYPLTDGLTRSIPAPLLSN